jgi:hypothetical protein
VGDNGSVDWAYTGSPTYPANLTTGNLATAVNAYLAGHSGEVDVPLRFILAPFATLNLTSMSATPVGQPDAQIGAGDIAFSATTPVETDPITVTATLHNPGTLASGGLTAVFYGMLSTGQPQGLPLQISAAYVPNIPANGTATASIPWDTTGFTGTVPVRVVIDPFNRVVEINETNNEATASLTILTRPDLQTTQVRPSNPEPVTGEAVTVTLSVHNAGQTAAGTQAVALYDGNPDAGGTLIAAQNLASLAGGTTVNMIFPWTPTTAGLHRLFARLDRDGQVNESDEGNNQSWRDVYVGFAGPLLLDSGGANDPPYSTTLGYGYLDGQVSAACGSQPDQTQRIDPDGQVQYRFDHLLPGHSYHLDITLSVCDGVGRREKVLVDGNLVQEAVDLSDQAVHRLSLLLDPALYADRSIVVAIEEIQGHDATVAQINLYDVYYRYGDAGGANDPAYPSPTGNGWLDGVTQTTWGTLPYQSRRIDVADANPNDDPDNELRYRFDGLDPSWRYQVHLTFYQGAAGAVEQTVFIDAFNTGPQVVLNGVQQRDVTVDVPVGAYAQDGSIVVRIVRTNSTANAFVNEISVEQKTMLTLPVIRDLRISNVSDNSATISWLTDLAVNGMVFFGPSETLGQIVHDDRGAATSSRTHHVTLAGLTPATTYYFYVSSADTMDDNSGDLYQFTTGPTLPPTSPDLIYGQVFLPDGTTPAAAAMVYITLHNADGLGSTGDAAPLSYIILATDDGYWSVDLGNARTTNNQQVFQYSASGDQVRLLATDGSTCMAEQVVDTANDAPAPAMTLTCPTQVSHNLAIGWNLLGLNVISDPMPLAEEALDDIEAQGGNASEINRWLNGGWNAHIHNLPFNNYPLGLGQGYFVKSLAAHAWQRNGRPPSNPLSLSLVPGWNLIGLPRLPGAMNAEQLLDGIEAQSGNCSEIDRWLNGGWNGHVHNLPFNNFTLRTDEGYFVKCTQGSAYVPRLPLAMDADKWGSPESGLQPPVVADPVIFEVLVTNRRDVAFTVTWRTDQPSDGWVEYGPTTNLGHSAYDDRGSGTVATLHHVTLSGLAPETIYYFRVHSGNTVVREGNQPFAVTTLPVTTPGTPITAYGQVQYGNGSPATGAMLIARLLDGSGTPSEPLSVLVDGYGYWVLSLPDVECGSTALHLRATSPDREVIDLTHAACECQPAPTIEFTAPPANRSLYLPLIWREQ